MNANFSAGSQALGYLFQVRYALYLVLTNREELEIAVESLDDITFFEKENNPKELLQLKHQTRKASLTDSSVDLWKTIRVWSTQLDKGEISLPGTLLTLVTTANAPESSAAFYLRPNQDRNTEIATQKLLEALEKSENMKLESSFNAFKNLTFEDQKLLLNSIHIIDSSLNIINLVSKTTETLIAVRREYREQVYERLEGWWFNKVVKHLRDDSKELNLEKKLRLIITKHKKLQRQLGDAERVADSKIERANNLLLEAQQVGLTPPGLVTEKTEDILAILRETINWKSEQITVPGNDRHSELREELEELHQNWKEHRLTIILVKI